LVVRKKKSSKRVSLPQVNFSQWKLQARDLSRSYSILFIVFVLVGLAALDWAAKRRENSAPNPETVPSESGFSGGPLIGDAWSYFHPTWNRVEKNKLLPAKTALPSTIDDVSEFLDDPEFKLESDFKIPPSLRKRVLFWMEIYAKYSSRVKVLHDRNDLSIVYGIIDLRPLYRALGNSPSVESKAYDIERRIVKELKSRLTESIDNGVKGTLAAEEKSKIRAFLSSAGALSATETQKLVERVRSQSGQRDMFLQALHRSSQLLPHIETVFRRRGLPVALARIPFVESSFNVNAKSDVGAMGIWQFMPETARQMISAEEKKHWSDPLKQTDSAAKLLQLYRNMLPDWGTTVTSYNSGVGRVRKMVQKFRLKNAEGLINLPLASDGLGFAGQNFYSEVLAANLVEAYKEKIFSRMLGPVDLAVVLKGTAPFPKDICDL